MKPLVARLWDSRDVFIHSQEKDYIGLNWIVTTPQPCSNTATNLTLPALHHEQPLTNKQSNLDAQQHYYIPSHSLMHESPAVRGDRPGPSGDIGQGDPAS